MLLFIEDTGSQHQILLRISIHLMLLFINSPRPLAVWACYFNTSHVTVYPCSAKTSLPDLYHFNTSHVTVYQQHQYHRGKTYYISIHLMLLFINSYLTDEQVTT